VQTNLAKRRPFAAHCRPSLCRPFAVHLPSICRTLPSIAAHCRPLLQLRVRQARCTHPPIAAHCKQTSPLPYAATKRNKEKTAMAPRGLQALLCKQYDLHILLLLFRLEAAW